MSKRVNVKTEERVTRGEKVEKEKEVEKDIHKYIDCKFFYLFT